MNILRISCFAHFQSLINYDIIFWGSSTSMCIVYLIQKRIIRVRLGLDPRSSCRGVFKKLGILTVSSLYIFAVIIFVVRNPNHFKTISCIHSIYMRQKINYIYHQWNFLQSKGIAYFSIKIFNKLSLNISKFCIDNLLFSALKKFLVQKASYTLDEFLSVNCDVNWHNRF